MRMNHAWLGLIFPIALLILCWGHISIFASIYGDTPPDQKEPITRFAVRAMDYDGSSGIVLVPLLLLSIPVLILGCLTGYYERQTDDRGVKWMCRMVGVLGAVLIYGLVMYVRSRT